MFEPSRGKMVEAKLSYEQIRLKRLEENKKRMEELNLNKLSKALRKSAKPSPAKQVKPRAARLPADLTPLRRSNRVADKPPPNYKDEPVEPLRGVRRSYQRRDLLNRVYASDKARLYAIERAEQVRSGLEPEFPSFVKPMLQSHVTGGFWLGLPVQFCKTHLPKYDETITLVNEEQEEFPTKYLADKTGLSAGWRGFAIDHQLVDGDALVFQLVSPTEFKVYIIRANESDSEDYKDDERDPETTHSNRRSKRIKTDRK